MAFLLLAGGPAPSARDFLDLGIRQYADGDFEAAVFSLDTAVRRFSPDADRAALADAYIHLGAAYVGLGHEEAAKGKFRAALHLDPRRRLSAEQFPAKVVQLFDSQVLKATATRRRRLGTAALVLGGAGAAGAVGAALLVSRPEEAPNRPPEAGIHVRPTGTALAGVTVMTFTAAASDLDGDALTFGWDFGDGQAAPGSSVTHVFTAAGTLRVTLTVEDGRGGTAAAGTSVIVGTLDGRWAPLTGGMLTYTLTQAGSKIMGLLLDGAHRYDVTGGVTGDRNVAWSAFRQDTGVLRYTFAGTVDERLETMTGIHRDEAFGGHTFTAVLRRD